MVAFINWSSRRHFFQAVGSISALLAGVAVVVLTNVQFPIDLEDPLLVLAGSLSAVVVRAMRRS